MKLRKEITGAAIRKKSYTPKRKERKITAQALRKKSHTPKKKISD